MKFFFPDSMDLVDPSFDFESETRDEERVRHRDDLYPHEVFPNPPYDGMLVSKAIVDGVDGGSGKYSVAQRHRFLRTGVREFFRLDRREETKRLETIGDCGAFTYVKEETPPYSVDEVIEFYEAGGFDYGVTIDHIILSYKPDHDQCLPGIDPVPDEWYRRQELTLELADRFYKAHKKGGCRFTPIGVVQGWSPKSCNKSLRVLQKIGYRKVAVGGLVALDSAEILQILGSLQTVRKPTTELHLFGVTRCEHLRRFLDYGVTSFDSTAPLRQAFKDDKNNYHTLDRSYTAVRVPQVGANARLKRRIASGDVDQREALKMESSCMDLLGRYDRGTVKLPAVLGALRDYEQIHAPNRDSTESNREVLEARPWRNCPCDVCRVIGFHVVIFRGAERNRRRGFHNLHVFSRRLQQQTARVSASCG